MKIPLQVIKNKMTQNGDSDKIPIFEEFVGNGSGSKPSSSAAGQKRKFRKKTEPWELPPGMEPKREIKPNKKMKPLHWNPVKPKDVKNTVWDGLDESIIKLDATTFEAMFHKKDRVKKPEKVSSPRPSSPKKVEEIKLVDGKRSYNVDIGLSRFKLSHLEIKNAILLMDETVLDVDKVMKLRNYIPDENEQETLRNFDGDKMLLAHTERFFLTLCRVPHLGERMELWQFRYSGTLQMPC